MGTVKKTYKILAANASPSAPFEVVKILPDGKKIVKSMNENAEGLTAAEVRQYEKDNYPELFILPDEVMPERTTRSAAATNVTVPEQIVEEIVTIPWYIRIWNKIKLFTKRIVYLIKTKKWH